MPTPSNYSDIINVALPKWPQMRVVGRKISPELAGEIIIRSDAWIEGNGSGGNNKDFQDQLARKLGLVAYDYTSEWRVNHQDAWDQFRQRIGFINTEYVRNDWISCCYIFGPHGWCQPDGTIFYNDNVGKWPSGEEIFQEWQLIAETWPQLHLEVTLMSGEYCEENIEPVLAIHVKNGKAEAFDPKDPNYVSEFEYNPAMNRRESILNDILNDHVSQIFSNDSRENKFTIDRVQQMVKAVLDDRKERFAALDKKVRALMSDDDYDFYQEYMANRAIG